MNEKLQNLFYAPIGLVVGAGEFLPQLAERGRIQVANARLMGQMATRMGTDRAIVGATRIADTVQSALVSAGLVARPVDEAVPSEQSAPTTPASAPALTVVSDPPAEADVTDAPASEELAIVEYDSLAASQVVPRLAALTAAELDDIRRYELAHRARKTILGRIAQLEN